MKRVLIAIVALSLSANLAAQGVADGELFVEAIREGNDGKIASIESSRGASVINYRAPDGETPLTVAMSKRSAAYVNFLLAKGADANLANKRGDSALIIAARNGFFEGVDRMLAARAAIDSSNRQGETALIAAVQGRHARIVRLLLEAGANPDKADIAAGYSARDYAKRDTRNPELLRLIETIKPARKSITGPIRF